MNDAIAKYIKTSPVSRILKALLKNGVKKNIKTNQMMNHRKCAVDYCITPKPKHTHTSRNQKSCGGRDEQKALIECHKILCVLP
jgi:hypothetical protein